MLNISTIQARRSIETPQVKMRTIQHEFADQFEE